MQKLKNNAQLTFLWFLAESGIDTKSQIVQEPVVTVCSEMECEEHIDGELASYFIQLYFSAISLRYEVYNFS